MSPIVRASPSLFSPLYNAYGSFQSAFETDPSILACNSSSHAAIGHGFPDCSPDPFSIWLRLYDDKRLVLRLLIDGRQTNHRSKIVLLHRLFALSDDKSLLADLLGPEPHRVLNHCIDEGLHPAVPEQSMDEARRREFAVSRLGLMFSSPRNLAKNRSATS